MNIREAILKAADQIAAHPELFNFSSIVVPRSTDCGSPGCAIGWIAHFVGDHVRLADTWLTDSVGLGNDCVFYCRMDALTEKRWMHDAAECARGLRLYADKYHQAETPKHVGIPASVRAIFDTAQSPALC